MDFMKEVSPANLAIQISYITFDQQLKSYDSLHS